MANKRTILVGCVGQGVMRSADDGENWRRMGVDNGLHTDSMVRTLVNHPSKPEVVFAGTEVGLYRSGDAGEHWTRVKSSLDDHCVWAIAINPSDPKVMFAGTGTPNPAMIFRSTDGGATWEKRPMEAADTCVNVGIPRVTGIAVDPVDDKDIWVGIEVDGTRRSTDGGETWETLNGGIDNPDVHNVLVAAGPPKTNFIVVNDEVYTSTDNGMTWNAVGLKKLFGLNYPRGIMVHPSDPRLVFLTLGDFTPGYTGTVVRSKDAGKTWEALSMPVQPNTAMWVVNAQPFDPDVVLAGSRYGYLYRSDDRGDSWTKVWREFSEISAVMWIPS